VLGLWWRVLAIWSGRFFAKKGKESFEAVAASTFLYVRGQGKSRGTPGSAERAEKKSGWVLVEATSGSFHLNTSGLVPGIIAGGLFVGRAGPDEDSGDRR